MIYSSTTDMNVHEEVNYLSGIEPTNVTPSYATLDEMVYYVIEANEKEFNNMMMNIGVAELHHLEESGTEMVYEAEDGKGANDKGKSLISRAVSMFQKLWSNFQGMVQNAIAALAKKNAEFKKKVIDKFGAKKIKEKAAAVAADKSFGKTYTYPNIKGQTSGIVNLARSNSSKVNDLISTATAKADNENDKALNELPEKLDAVVNAARISAAGDAKAPSEIKSAMTKAVRGAEVEYKGAKVKSEIDSIVKEVENFSLAKNQLKKDYNDAHKVYNECIKNARSHTFLKRGFDAKAYSLAIKAYKNLSQLLVYSEQAVISCLNERNRFFISVIIKLVGSKTKTEEKKSVGESSTFDRVSSLFEW